MTPVSIALRALLGARRTWVLGVLSVIAGAIAVLIRVRADEFRWLDRYAEVTESLTIPTVVAFVALVLGASVVGDEREDWTILYLAATPVSRVRLAGAWVLAAWLMALVLLVPATAGAAWLGLGGGMGARGLLWLVVAVALASLAYAALGVLLALLVRRAIILGLLYIVLWEATIATFADSADKLSLGAYGRRLVAEGVPGAEEFRVPPVGAVTAVVVLIAVSAVGVWAGGRRLSRMELP
ncbi:MAG: hypothetical protein U0237_14245 [Thermoleophilia bacterium]